MCKTAFKQLTNSHFKRCHNTTIHDIKIQFPNIQLKSDATYSLECKQMVLKRHLAVKFKNTEKKQRVIEYNSNPKCCQQCSKPISYTNKRYADFCSHKCAAVFNKSHLSFSVKRSKAEMYMERLLTKSFPLIPIETNNRSVLSTKFEIDILLPTIKLAIEINGPTHFIPVHGDEILKKIQNRDLQKVLELQKLNYTFFVIDISQFTNFEKTVKYLDIIFIKQIKPFIEQYQKEMVR